MSSGQRRGGERSPCVVAVRLSFASAVIPPVSPLIIPLLYCHINGFQRAFSVEKPWLGGEKRRGGRAAPPVAW
jgi:hypothetical protein